MDMSQGPSTGTDARFTITHEGGETDALIAGLTEFGLAGLTAADFLVDYMELVERGYLTVEQIPEITPFEGGQPRHHTRFFSRSDLDVSVLTGELFVPVGASRSFADTVLDWMNREGVGEVTMLSGVPIAHVPKNTGRSTWRPRITARVVLRKLRYHRWRIGSSTVSTRPS